MAQQFHNLPRAGMKRAAGSHHEQPHSRRHCGGHRGDRGPRPDRCPFYSTNRRFKPEEFYIHPEVVPNHVEVPYESGWSYLACKGATISECCGKVQGHSGEIVVAVDGACSNNGTPRAKAASAAYFGPSNPYNATCSLEVERSTNQMAEIIAAWSALKQAEKLVEDRVDGEPLVKVCIKTDSIYLVQAMSQWIFRWKRNGFRTHKRHPVTNTEKFQMLEELVKKFEDIGIEVLFWHVPRRMNTDADFMAKEALRGRV